MFVCSGKQARSIDQRASEKYNIPSLDLMEQAAIECWKQLQSYKEKKLMVLCGPGNNGGDGMALARLAIQDGFNVIVSYIGTTMSQSQQVQYQRLQKMNIPILENMESIHNSIQQAEILIDCIFGNGCNRQVRGNYKTTIDWMNASNKEIIAIDVPSGLNADTGKEMGACVHATQTLALDCFKEGMFIEDGPSVCGKIQCLDIGIVHEEKDGIIWIDQQLAQTLLPIRSNLSHKGTFGKALMIGGSQSMPGALSMAAKACYSSGIGTLTLMMPDSIADLMMTKIDFAMRIIGSDDNGTFGKETIPLLKDSIKNYDVISIGNGLGRTQITKQMVQTVLKSEKPVLLDADAFWAIQDCPELLNRPAPTIVTPHIKECSMVLGMESKKVAANPIEAARVFAKKYPEVVLVLKSHSTLVVQGENEYLWSYPNSALAKGGSGDILCGIICGLFGQRKDALSSAILGVYLHALSAQTKKDPACAGPDDFLEQLNHLFTKLRKAT